MKSRLILLAFFGPALCSGQYVYDWGCTWSNPSTCYAASSDFGSLYAYGVADVLFASSPVSGNPNDYEIKSQLAVKGSGETYIHFLRASSYTYHAGGYYHTPADYISAEIDIPTNFQTPGPATLSIKQGVNGTVTLLASTSISANDGMTFRTVIWGTNLWVFINNVQVLVQTVPLTTGYPGFGGVSLAISSGDAFTTLQVGHHDTVSPNQISAQSVATSLLPYAASFKWQAVPDDPIGIGVAQYLLSRNGTQIATSQTDKSFTDATVRPSTAYAYTLQALDYHGNLGAPTTVNITTPPAGAVDPRRTGVYSTGSYWGGGGEQIDTLSGNLNFSVPLVTAQGRTGWTVPAGLTYNSQNWRQDNGVNWQLGDDVGYGFGWKLLVGSMTPYYASTWSGIDHYVYTDSTGTEYRLDQNNNGVWSSTQGIYVWFDSNAGVLHFKDGRFRVMGCTAGGIEPDAGTMYPTVIEDLAGNQVVLNYQSGVGLGSAQINTSARINMIEDVRAPQCVRTYVPSTVNCATYTFGYNTDLPVPHLISITNPLQTSENYTIGYSAASLGPPFGTDPNWAGMTTTHLANVSVVSANQYQFAYDTAGAAELTQVTFPFGGHLRWNYVSDAFNGSRFLRAVGTRYLAADSAGATEWQYPITRDNASGATLHAWMSLADASGIGSKTWNFTASAGAPAWQLGLLSELVQKPGLSSGAILQDDTYTWSQEPIAGNFYISAKTTVMDEGTANQQSALTTQVIDQYGNVTQLGKYPYNNTSGPLQTYANTYLTTSAYTSNYMFNRLVTSTLTTGGSTKTLVQNTYDTNGQLFINNQNFSYGDWTSSSPPDVDPAPPVPRGSRGEVVSTTTPAHTAWVANAFGGVLGVAPTDGQTIGMGLTSANNYAAPPTIATQTYSQSLEYNAWLGVTQTTGANGGVLAMTYDSIGRPATARNSPLNSGLPPLYTYTYSAENVTPATQTKTGPDGVTITTLDGLGRAIRVQRGDSASVDSTTSYTDTVYAPCACSPLGKLQQVSQPYAPGGTPAWTVYTYDGLGRTVSVRQPDGASTTSYAYSGNQTTATDPAGNWKQLTTDVQGNLTTVVEPDPANQPSVTLTTSYSYDWMNHVTQVTMPRGASPNTVTQTRTFTYNNAGLLTSATNPENGTVSYYYNADNTLQYKQDAKGQQTVYSYDGGKRVIETQRFPAGQSNAEDVCQQVRYWWDYGSTANLGRISVVLYAPVNSAGNSCIAGSPATNYIEWYNYTSSGQVLNKTLQMTRNSQTSYIVVNYGYDKAERNTSIQYPLATPFTQTGTSVGNIYFSYAFDAMSRPVSLTDLNYKSWNWAQGAQYDIASRLTSLQYIAGAPSGTPGYTTETMAYNANGQMVSQNWSTPSSLGPTGGLLYSYSGTQNNGQITQTSDTLSGETISYQYDALKRLTSASSTPQTGSSTTPWTQNFQFDGFGNLTAKLLNGTSTPIAVNAATNQLSNAGYDLNGNMTSGVGATLTYDEANRMTSAAEVSGGTEYYSYSPDNKRIYRLTASGTEEWTFYGGYGEKLGVFQYNSTAGLYPVRSNVQFAGRTIIDDNYPVFQDRVGTNRASGNFCLTQLGQ